MRDDGGPTDGVLSQRIEGRDGAPSLEVLHTGPADGEGPTPVLFVHGYTSGAWQFAQSVMPALARDGRASWAVNLRGHGGSEGRDGLRKVRFTEYAADLARAVAHVEAVEGRTPILVGHSLGSVLARDYAGRHTLPGLALVSFGDIKFGMGGFMVWMMRRFPLGGMTGMLTGRPSALFAKFEPQYAVMYDGHPREAVRANVERLMAQPDSDKVFMELGKLDLDRPLGNPPVLVMAGDRDPIASVTAVEALARDLGTDPVILDDAAHDLFAGPNWKRGYRELTEWLAQGGA